jgi:uncharacterized membrane protein
MAPPPCPIGFSEPEIAMEVVLIIALVLGVPLMLIIGVLTLLARVGQLERDARARHTDIARLRQEVRRLVQTVERQGIEPAATVSVADFDERERLADDAAAALLRPPGPLPTAIPHVWAEPHAPRAEVREVEDDVDEGPSDELTGDAPSKEFAEEFAEDLADEPVPKPTVRRPAREAQKIDWERWLGVRGAAVVGGIALTFAALFFVQLAIQRGWLGPLARDTIAVVAGATLLALHGTLRRRSYDVLADVLAGAGTVLVYLGAWAAARVHDLVPVAEAFAVMAATTIVAGRRSAAVRSPLLAAFALVGGFATPLLLDIGQRSTTALFGYLSALTFGALVFGRATQWAWVPRVVVLASAVVQVHWYFAAIVVGLEPSVPPTGALLAVSSLAFVHLATTAGTERKGSRVAPTVLVALVVQVLFAVHLGGYLAEESSLAPTAAMAVLLAVFTSFVGRRLADPSLSFIGGAAGFVLLAAWTFQHPARFGAGAADLLRDYCVGAMALAGSLAAVRAWERRRDAEPDAGSAADLHLEGVALAVISVAAALLVALSALVQGAPNAASVPLVAGTVAVLAVLALAHAPLPARPWIGLGVGAVGGYALAAMAVPARAQTWLSFDGVVPSPTWALFGLVLAAVLWPRRSFGRFSDFGAGAPLAAAAAAVSGLVVLVRATVDLDPVARALRAELPFVAALLVPLAALAISRTAVSRLESADMAAEPAPGVVARARARQACAVAALGLGFAGLVAAAAWFSTAIEVLPAARGRWPWMLGALAAPVFAIALERLALRPGGASDVNGVGAHRSLRAWAAVFPAVVVLAPVAVTYAKHVDVRLSSLHVLVAVPLAAAALSSVALARLGVGVGTDASGSRSTQDVPARAVAMVCAADGVWFAAGGALLARALVLRIDLHPTLTSLALAAIVCGLVARYAMGAVSGFASDPGSRNTKNSASSRPHGDLVAVTLSVVLGLVAAFLFLGAGLSGEVFRREPTLWPWRLVATTACIAAGLSFAVGALRGARLPGGGALRAFLLATLFLGLNLLVVNGFARGTFVALDGRDVPGRDLGLSFAWALYGGVLLALGRQRDSRPLRWVSLGVFLATIVKVFLFDLGALEGGYRVASFAGLALALLAVSVVYQRWVLPPSDRATGPGRGAEP